jgi:hypothetical protein
MVTLNLHQTKALVGLFGDDLECDIQVIKVEEGHSGPGIYAVYDEYPEEGSIHLPEEPDPIKEQEATILRVQTFLGLVAIEVSDDEVRGWGQETRKLVIDWAAAEHAYASDNPDVERLEKPSFLPAETPIQFPPHMPKEAS